MVGRRRPGGPSARHATSTRTRWSSGPGSAVRSPRTGWPRRAAPSSCWSAGRRTRRAASPARPRAMGRNFWDPSEGMQGLFDVWTFRGLEGVVSSGLGGGSLIYANVLLRKDEKWFVQDSPVPGGGYESWPLSRADLDPHYDRVEQMLGATPYPYPATAKTTAMRDSAARLGLDWQLPPLAVTFAGRPQDPPVPGAPIPTPAYGNVHGRPRTTCRLCGECDIGCNDGAKNTLDHTYLSAAAHHGADLRTRCEVRGFAPLRGGGYEVRYVVHDPADEGRPTSTSAKPLHRITCDRLVLGAGTFGTTYLLLRNRAALPGHEPHAGHPVLRQRRPARPSCSTRRTPTAPSGRRRIEGSRGHGDHQRDPGRRRARRRRRDRPRLLRRGRRLPGVRRLAGREHPAARAGPPAAAVRAPTGPRHARRVAEDRHLAPTSPSLIGPGRPVGRLAAAARHGPRHPGRRDAAAQGTPRGRLDDDDLGGLLRAGARHDARASSDDLGATFQDNPLWWTRRVVTVHPLGGVPMGRHVAEGVCDDTGEVFGFPGLHVLDGSAMPGPVGANPSLTIAAFADRASDRMTATRPRSVRRPTEEVITLPEQTGSTGRRAGRTTDATNLSFTEEMKGFVALDVDDPVRGAELGRQLDQRLMFHLTITAEDVDRFVVDPQHLGTATGYVECDLLGGRQEVQRAWFNLFTQDDDPTRRKMLYRLHFADAGGNPLTLVGHKDVHDDPGVDVWQDTSTLYTRILAGHVPPGADDGSRRRRRHHHASTCPTSCVSSRRSAPRDPTRCTRWRRSAGSSSASSGRSTDRRWWGAGDDRPAPEPSAEAAREPRRPAVPPAPGRALVRPAHAAADRRSWSRSRRSSGRTPTSARRRRPRPPSRSTTTRAPTRPGSTTSATSATASTPPTRWPTCWPSPSST